jgi:hypothetical protein
VAVEKDHSDFSSTVLLLDVGILFAARLCPTAIGKLFMEVDDCLRDRSRGVSAGKELDFPLILQYRKLQGEFLDIRMLTQLADRMDLKRTDS